MDFRKNPLPFNDVDFFQPIERNGHEVFFFDPFFGVDKNLPLLFVGDPIGNPFFNQKLSNFPSNTVHDDPDLIGLVFQESSLLLFLDPLRSFILLLSLSGKNFRIDDDSFDPVGHLQGCIPDVSGFLSEDGPK